MLIQVNSITALFIDDRYITTDVIQALLKASICEYKYTSEAGSNWKVEPTELLMQKFDVSDLIL